MFGSSSQTVSNVTIGNVNKTKEYKQYYSNQNTSLLISSQDEYDSGSDYDYLVKEFEFGKVYQNNSVDTSEYYEDLLD